MRGGVIFRIIAPMRTMKKMQEETGNNVEEIGKIKAHISETALDNMDTDGDTLFDAIIYNDNATNCSLIPELIEPLLCRITTKEKMA